ncbi:MAG: hypothetical protein JW839_07130 [Candidatus Lokiarchaeota archaeon]|nr:hypothetical protein [Candidatus Lokiarchaeota archaeon]
MITTLILALGSRSCKSAAWSQHHARIKEDAITTGQHPGPGKAKIIMAGLDGAGKRTILDLVQDKMIHVLDAQPTKGLARREAEIMGKSIMIRDLSGQGSYRKMYLSKPAYLEQASAFVFVVDLKDTDRHGDAIEHFEHALTIFVAFEMRPKVYLMLHKFDEEYRVDYYDPSRKVRDEFLALKGRFSSIARKCGFHIEEAYRTSVSDMWSVYSAFYDVWTAIITRLASIESYLSRFIEGLGDVHLAVLLDADRNIIAEKASGGDLDLVDDLANLAMDAIAFMVKVKGTNAGARMRDINSASVSVAGSCIIIRKIEVEGKAFHVIVVKESSPDVEGWWVINQLAESLAVFLAVPGSGASA